MRADRIAISGAAVKELLDVLDRPGMSRFINAAQRLALLGQLLGSGVPFNPTARVTDCRDAKDNKYLELALAAGAERIVSSDSDLLVLHPWRGVRILKPADYLKEVG